MHALTLHHGRHAYDPMSEKPERADEHSDNDADERKDLRRVKRGVYADFGEHARQAITQSTTYPAARAAYPPGHSAVGVEPAASA